MAIVGSQDHHRAIINSVCNRKIKKQNKGLVGLFFYYYFFFFVGPSLPPACRLSLMCL